MWKFLVSAIVTAILVWVLNHPLQFGSTRLPPLGKLFSPAMGFWNNSEFNEPEQMTFRMNGLAADVRVVFDDRLVPHIYADNIDDLYYAQGYITAMHRLWQMDISARAAAGRISEILGPRSLAFDQRQREMGMTFGADNAIASWQKYPDYMRLLEQYSAGVNAYIDQLKPADYPIEFKLIGYAPEHWTPYHSALFTKNMALTLCSRAYDLEFSNLLAWLGQEQFDELFPEYNPAQDPIIPPATTWDFEPVHIAGQPQVPVGLLPATGMRDEPDHDDQEGSNNWAVAGSKTASGKPILCNDPHLGLTLPSIWYEVHLNAPDYHCYGVSFPGLPAIIIGFNEHIAWGVTNAGHDVMDWYTIQWANDTQTMYIVDGKAREVEYRIEEIGVRGGETVIDTVKYTIWGPIAKSGPHRGLSRRWIAHDKSRFAEPSVFTRLNQARNIDEFISAVGVFQSPAQNFVYADQAGNIALRVAGQLPLRRQGQGRFVLDGSNSENTWAGFIPQAHNPITINPARGYVSSANQRTTDQSYPYYYVGGRQFEDYRGRILNQKLGAMEDIEVADLQALQNSAESLKAREILPALLEAISADQLDATTRDIYDTLKSWDYRYSADASAPVYFEEWYSRFYDLVWDEFDELEDSLSVVRPESWKTIDLALNDPASPYFDLQATTDTVESFKDIALLSLINIVATLSTGNHDTWSAYQPTTIRHLANLPGFDERVENAPGHGDALNARTRTNGPSWRMVVHMTNPVEAYVIYPGGQSGNPGSPYYDDMIEEWATGLYYPAIFTDDQNAIESHRTIDLKAKP